MNQISDLPPKKIKKKLFANCVFCKTSIFFVMETKWNLLYKKNMNTNFVVHNLIMRKVYQQINTNLKELNK